SGVLVLGSYGFGHEPDVRAQQDDPKPEVSIVDGHVDVQIALLLDTSNSMDGLINQARTQLWRIVNEFSKSKRDGRIPTIQVALFEYGNDTISSGEGHVRMVLPFTNDLDRVSEALFALKTNGGSEYCGRVIRDASDGLRWNTDSKTYKTIFIAGNEPFTQGEVQYQEAIAAVRGKGVRVNTIHCGPNDDGITGMWKDAANLGRGEYLYINQDRVEVAIATPCDDALLKLNERLNRTYVPYGRFGDEGKMRQTAQDSNATEAAPQVAAERAATKAGPGYMNSSWDLVDAVTQNTVKLEEVDRAQLPADLKDLPLDDLQTALDGFAKERAEIQAEMGKLSAEREAFIEKAQAEQAENGEETFDSAAVKVVKEQMKEEGFEVSE
ncbi:MAG TPA: VWA domain-containing protein, partial [Tepidisphaeraceae bacterium]|nr:VWA domain-containing protein [Tepidisphaeraceae bacterium]